MSADYNCFDHSQLNDPLGKRRKGKQTLHGTTMVIDKGLGIRSFQDLLEVGGAYIDFIKLGFGTAALYPEDVLQKKIRLAAEKEIVVYPGGTFFEVAYSLDQLERYFQTLKKLGFSRAEISDGTIELPFAERETAIRLAKNYGFDVVTEYGKKMTGSFIAIEPLLQTIKNDLEHGADYIIVEGRESGEDVGIYDKNGQFRDTFPQIAQLVQPYIERLIWEAPQKSQQVELLSHFGPNVHLGNIAPGDILSVESLRRGLRADTFFFGQRGGRT
jgi:phosphosulfolactate synthase